MTRSLILSGGGEYRDPWHPFAATSERLAGLLRTLGHEVEISELVADRVADLHGWDLVVVNAAAGPEADTSAAAAGLRAALGRGVGVLAIHVGACTLLRLPGLGIGDRRRLDQRPVHAPQGGAGPDHHLSRAASHLRAGRGLRHHRRALRLPADRAGIVPLAAHEHEGEIHPLLWARVLGRSRVVTDALGHDERSYDSAVAPRADLPRRSVADRGRCKRGTAHR